MAFVLSGERYNAYGKYSNPEWPNVHPQRNPDELDEQLRTDWLEVRETSGAETGRGLHARESLKQGQEVFVFDGEKSAERIDNETVAMWMAGSNPNAVVVAREGDLWDKTYGPFIYAAPDDKSPLRYLNHSCEPNVARSEKDAFSFVALRDIQAGEQLVADYSLLETNPEWGMECSCGSDDCRGSIHALPAMPIEFLAKNWHSLPKAMKQYALERSESPVVQDFVREHGVLNAVETFTEQFVSPTHEQEEVR